MNVKTVKIHVLGTLQERVTKKRADSYFGVFYQALYAIRPATHLQLLPLFGSQHIHATSRLGHEVWAARLTGIIIHLMHEDALLVEMDWSRLQIAMKV